MQIPDVNYSHRMNFNILKRDPKQMTPVERKAAALTVNYVLSPRGKDLPAEVRADAAAALESLTESLQELRTGLSNGKAASPATIQAVKETIASARSFLGSPTKPVTAATKPVAPRPIANAAAAKQQAEANEKKLMSAIRSAACAVWGNSWWGTASEEQMLVKLYQADCNTVFGLADACFEGTFKTEAFGMERAVRAHNKMKFAEAFSKAMQTK